MENKKQNILDTVEDAVTDLLFYDRKEGDELPVGEIERQIKAGHISQTEIVEHFASELDKQLEL